MFLGPQPPIELDEDTVFTLDHLLIMQAIMSARDHRLEGIAWALGELLQASLAVLDNGDSSEQPGCQPSASGK